MSSNGFCPCVREPSNVPPVALSNWPLIGPPALPPNTPPRIASRNPMIPPAGVRDAVYAAMAQMPDEDFDSNALKRHRLRMSRHLHGFIQFHRRGQIQLGASREAQMRDVVGEKHSPCPFDKYPQLATQCRHSRQVIGAP